MIFRRTGSAWKASVSSQFLSSLMAFADGRGQTSHLHNSFHFRASDKCLPTRRRSVKSEYSSGFPAERRFSKLNLRSSLFVCGVLFFYYFFYKRKPNQIQRKDGGKQKVIKHLSLNLWKAKRFWLESSTSCRSKRSWMMKADETGNPVSGSQASASL